MRKGAGTNMVSCLTVKGPRAMLDTCGAMDSDIVTALVEEHSVQDRKRKTGRVMAVLYILYIERIELPSGAASDGGDLSSVVFITEVPE